MQKILRDRMERAQKALLDNRIDIWISIGRETHFLSEPAMLYLMPADVLMKTALILTKSGEKLCFCTSLESEEFEASELFTSVIRYDGQLGFAPLLADLLGIYMPIGKLALNISPLDPSADGLRYSDFLLIRRCLDEVGFSGEIVSSEPIMKQIRGRKGENEVEMISMAVQMAMRVYNQARPCIKQGMSGADIQKLFQHIMSGHGLGYSWYEPNNPFVSVGTRSSYFCKHPPADVFVNPGDVVNVDLGVRLNGFASDNQRTFYAPFPGETEPPEEVRRAFATLQCMNREVCAAMKTGANSNDLTAIGDRTMRECGYPDGWGGAFGHELGLYAHNGGISAGYSSTKQGLDTILEENMTFTLEPAIITSRGRVCQEEVVCVTERGGVMLSTPQTEVWMIDQ